MKTTLPIVILIFTLASSFSVDKKCNAKGTWKLSLVAYRGDTLFVKDNPSYTFAYHYKREGLIKDSLSQEQIEYNGKLAMTSFTNFSNVKMTFKGSKFTTTKIKRNGSIMDEVYEGTFTNINDTIYLNFATRNEREALYLDCKNKKLVLFKESGPLFEYQR